MDDVTSRPYEARLWTFVVFLVQLSRAHHGNCVCDCSPRPLETLSLCPHFLHLLNPEGRNSMSLQNVPKHPKTTGQS